MGAAWTTFLAAAVAGLLLVGGLGAAVGVAMGLRGSRLAAASGVIGVGVAGVAGVAASLSGAGFTVLWLCGIALVGVASSLLVRHRRLILRAGGSDRPNRRSPVLPRRRPTQMSRVVVAAATVISIAVIGATTLVGIGGPDRFSQTYDGVFHLSAIAYILQNGDASSFTLYRMTNPSDGIEFYPAAWHTIVASVVQLSGASIPVASNAVWVTVVGGTWVTGCAFLTDVVWAGRRFRIIVVALGALLASAFSAFPHLLLDWGTLYPTALAYSLLPFGVATAFAFVFSRSPWSSLSLFAAWVAATTFSHPRSFATALLFLIPLAIEGAVPRTRALLERPGGRRRVYLISAGFVATVLLIAAAGALYVYRTYDVANRPISDHLNGGPATARQTLGESLLQAVLQAPPLGPGETALAPAPLLAVVVLVGVVVAVLTPRLRWVAVSFVGVVILYSLAAGSNSDFAKLATGVWYKDKYRLLAAIPVVAVPAAALAIGALLGRLPSSDGSRRSSRSPAVTASLLGGAVLLTSWLGPTLAGTRDSLAEVFALPPVKNGYLIDEDGATLLAQLDETVPAGEKVLGNPWDGSSLSWVLGSREPVFPALTGAWDADRLLVASHLDQAGKDPDVCAALDRLGVEYVFRAPGLLWNGDPAADVFQGIDRAAESGALTVVARIGSATLSRITACG